MRTRLDVDGDGKLSVAELADSRMARRLGDLTELDTNHDGDVSSAELQTSMDKMREQMRARGGGGRAGGRGRGGGRFPQGAPTPGEPTPAE
jgi:Ca2+-binding EF-hand superfamily protein